MAHSTFKDLNKKQKIEHIWEYYRWHILGTIVGIIFIGSLIGTMLRPKPPVASADLIVTGNMLVDEVKFEETQAAFREAFNVGISTIPCDWANPSQLTITNDQVLMLRFQVRECDVLAISPARHEGYMAIEDFDAFAMLDEIPELQPILEKYQDALITKVGVDGKEHVYGIQTSKLNHLEGITLVEDYIISMITNPKDMTAAVNLIKYLLE